MFIGVSANFELSSFSVAWNFIRFGELF